ncbi:MAG: metallophosphoesterase family protein [candidate division Zixibacteria bacterium]|nr:metallophosphoesterase family protein [candidate division Zixibacteria bacterium]
MKTRFTFFSVLAVLFTAALAPVGAAKAVGIFKKGPYLQQVTQTSIVIMWETDVASDSRVDYGSSDSYGESETDDTLVNVKIHEIGLDGLIANTKYYYKVTSDNVTDDGVEATGDPYTFTTAPEGDQYFCFVAYGDTRTYPEDHAKVIAAIINSSPAIVIHTGDLVANGNDPDQWGPQFFTPAYPLMTNTPMFPVLGNHEYNDKGETLFFDFFSLPDNEQKNEQWYSFTYGCVQFIALDTNTNVDYSPGSPQYIWLEKELNYSATWRIVYFHHPPYTRTSGHEDDEDVKRDLVPLFENKVDMVFSGHSHAYERYFNEGVYYIVTGGGGAPLHRPLKDKNIPIRQVGEKEYHHCVIDVDSESLTLSARDNDGNEFDTITIKSGQSTLDMHVHDIDMSYKVAGPNHSGIATICIKDTSGTNVKGATVSGKWSWPDLVDEAVSGITGVDGEVKLQSSKIKSGGIFTFTVTNVVDSVYTYNSELNEETSDSIDVP